MKDAILLLLCAVVALAQGINQDPEQRSRPCNCDPSEAQQICQANYDNDDVLIAHEYCDKFYKCANGKPVAFYCPNNLLYDPFTETCEWPYDVECGNRPISDGPSKDEDSDSDDVSEVDNDWTCNCNPGEAPSICAAEGSNGIFVAHQNCNQFYQCAEGRPVSFYCAPTLLYNPYKEECDWPQNVECGDRVISDPEEDNDSDDEDTENDGTCNCNPEEAPAICAAPGSESVLIAHENCNQYYICNHGIPVAVSCFGNLLFNPYSKQCDWPTNVDCGDRLVPESECPGCNDNTSDDTSCDGDDVPPEDDEAPPPGNAPEDSDSSDIRPPGDDVVVPTRPPGTCNCNPGEAPSICAAEDSSGVVVAHENCNQFYKCDHGKPVVFTCHGDLLYNPYTEQCDWPENVDCGDRVIPDPDESPTTEGGTTSGVTNPGVTNPAVTTPGSTAPGNNCDPSEAPAICAGDDSEGVLVAHENCNQFYVCSGGKPVALTCPPNLLFNPAKDQCDWPFNVDCGDRVIPDPESSDSDSSDIRPPGDDVVVPTRPPGTCNCNPEEAPSICAAEDSNGVLIAHENCNQFYKCDHGKPVVFTCHGDLLYNPYTEQCDWPENVDCGDRVIPDPDESPTTEGGTTSGVTNPGVTNPAVTTPGSTAPGNNCDPSEAPAICAEDDSEGVLVAHENCNQFYVCSGGKPVALTCPPNLLFNPAKDQCDWPFNVDCGDRVIPDPESSDSDSSDIRPPGDDVVVPTRPPGTCNCNPEEAPSICAAEDSSGVLIAHENCNQFYKCDHGKPVVFTCHGDLLYNPYTEQCDWPENVDCGDRVIPDPDESPTTEGGTTSGVTNPGVTNPAITTPGSTAPGNNCDPSEAPAICAEDDSEGVLVAHENCNQFYVCSGGKPVALTCPPNLLFNPAKDQCDWPFNVDCGDRVIPDPESSDSDSSDIRPPGDDVVVPTRPPGTCNCNPEEAPSICAAEDSSGILIAHENCNQFYKCDHGKPVVFTCHGDLLYNPYTEQCDWPENVDCGDRVIPDPDESPTTEGGTTSGVTNPGVTNPAVTTPGSTAPGNNCDPSEAPAICAEDDSEGVLVAHENCNQFYVCSGGKPVALTCPPNLLFNPAKDQCDWPFNVDCGDRVIPDPESSDSDSSDIRPPGDDVVVPTRPPGTCNCNPEEAPSICAAEDSSGVLIAHENCNQFYKCDHGKPVVFTCHGDLLYNPYTEQCDWPENVDCGDRVIPDPDESPTTEGGTTSGVTNPGVTNPAITTPGSTAPGNNCDPSEAPAICAEDDSEGVLVAHENCNQFYVCSGGKPVALTCPPNLLFNPAKDQCDWPFNVDCGDRVIPDPESSDSDSSDIRPPGDDVVVPTRPPGTCNCNPEEAPSICAAEDSSGILIAHENCNQFYKCDHGKPVVFTCHGDLLYNPYTEQCDWPENVDCGDRVIPDPDESPTTEGGTTSGVTNPGVTNPAVTTPGSTAPGNNCDPSEAPAICAEDDSEGVLVAHENCNQFYVCSGGKPVALTCPPNLLFNPAKDQCDWPFNVDCGDRVIPDPESSDSDSSDIRPPGDDVVVPTRPPGTCNCNPEEAPSICAAEDSSGVLIAHENCNQFYKCDHGKPVVFTCHGDLLYNPYTEQCDWPENVDCGDRVIPDPDESPTTEGGTTSGVTNPGVTNPAVTTPGSTAPGNNCDPSEAPAICAEDDSEGVLVAHENCNQFYVCSGGKPVALTCPPNLLFNPAKDQCDWPFNVDCGDRVIPDPESSDSDSSDIRPPGDDVVVPTRPPGTCNCNPEEAPSICAAEDSSGVLIAHENCNQFYKCDHGKPVVFTCHGDLLYNPYTEQCDWPENVDCGDRVIPDPDESPTTEGGTTSGVTNPGVTNPAVTTPGSTAPGNNCDPSEAPAICAEDDSEGVLVAHENCNQFYVCSGGKPVALTCPPNLLFNPAKDQCDWPFNVDCGDRVIPDPESSDSDSSDIRPPGDDVVVPTRPPGTCNCNPEEAPSICAAEDSNGVLIAHENCNQFYKCDHGKPVVFTCHGDLLYNPYTEQCDWPENVDCGDRVIPDPDENPTTEGGTTSGVTNPGVTNPAVTTPGSTAPGNNCDPSEAPAICAEDDSEGVLVAHENCNQFYVCSGGKPVALTCPPNLLFNPAKDQCDWPFNVDCGDRVIPDPESSDSDSSDIRPPGDDVVVPTRPPGTCNCNPEEAPSICAAEDSSGVLIAHENCNQFYKCDHGKPVVVTCHGDLLYNPYTEQCDWPENVDCGDRVIPDDSGTTPGVTNPVVTTPTATTPAATTPAATTPAVTTPAVTTSAATTPAATTPAATTSESDSDSSEIRPPGDDVPPQPPVDSNETKDCSGNSDENSGTCNCDPDQAPSICAIDNSDGILIAHENCNQFYKCDNGRPVAFKCPSNTLYNPVTQGCDWHFNVDCGDRIIPDPEDNVSESNEVESEEEEIVGPCNCNPEEAPAICAVDGSSGVQIAHQNCNQFYVCDHGGPVAFTCNGFLLYNPYTQNCDWPANVECGDRVIPDPVSDESDSDSNGDNNSNTVNDDPSQAPTICAGYGAEGVLVAHENCDQYYICSGGVPVTRPCSGGLLYNPNNEQCDWPSNVNCGDRIVPDDCACNFRNAPALCGKPESDGKLVAHENCNQFYICSHSVPVAQTCPASLLYNTDSELCDWPQNVNCENRILSKSSLNKHWQSRQTLRH